MKKLTNAEMRSIKGGKAIQPPAQACKTLGAVCTNGCTDNSGDCCAGLTCTGNGKTGAPGICVILN
ncbi:hypothetical protein ACTHGU_17275 [Chitinophagaceae bacterium MMS25-I14]